MRLPSAFVIISSFVHVGTMPLQPLGLISVLIFFFYRIVCLSTPCSAFFIASNSGFRPCPSHLSGSTLSPISSRKKKSSTQLYLQRNTTQGETAGFLQERIEDSGLLVGDIFAIAISSQLIGLLDVLNDPEFVRSGGWLQPIPTVPSTLNVLVERISTLSLTWLLVALARKDSYSSVSISTDNAAIKKALRIVLDFTLLRFIFAFALAYVTHTDLDFGSIIRECYFTALFVPGFRFLYGRYFR